MRNRYALVDSDVAFSEIATLLGVALGRPNWAARQGGELITGITPAHR